MLSKEEYKNTCKLLDEILSFKRDNIYLISIDLLHV